MSAASLLQSIEYKSDQQQQNMADFVLYVKSKHIKGSIECYLLAQKKKKCKFLILKLQNDT